MNRKYLFTLKAEFEEPGTGHMSFGGNLIVVGPESPSEKFLIQVKEKFCYQFNQKQAVSTILGPGDVTILFVLPLEVVDKIHFRK